MEGIEQIGALIGGASAGFIAVLGLVLGLFRHSRKGDAARTAHEVRKLLVGDADATPENIDQDNTGVMKLVLRTELKPIRDEQRKQGRKLDHHGQILETLMQGHEQLEAHAREISGRVATVEGAKASTEG